MKTVCELNKCAGCMACINICPKEAIEIKDDLYAYNAVINADKCIDCNVCHRICPTNNPEGFGKPIKWYQGWAKNQDLRQKSSSGGYATAISEAFIDSGGAVCGCAFKNGEFIFEIAENKDELKKFMGSKYVKSNPSDSYKLVKMLLTSGRRILFIGLPCQVSAMKNFVGKKAGENLYTIDLICHGTPSPKLLEIFLNQYNCKLSKIRNIRFRVNTVYMISCDNNALIKKGVRDKYSIAFLNSLIHTENCYSCIYARKERISDVTLGDSWGSELSVDEQKKGISLALCQTEKGNELIAMAEIYLNSVDIDKAIENNHQLNYPSSMPKGRKKFFHGISKRKFNYLVFQQFPGQCLKQDIKQILIRMGLLKKYKK